MEGWGQCIEVVHPDARSFPPSSEREVQLLLMVHQCLDESIRILPELHISNHGRHHVGSDALQVRVHLQPDRAIVHLRSEGRLDLVEEWDQCPAQRRG